MRIRFSSGRAYSIVLPGHTSYGALATSDRRLAGVTLLKQQGAVGVKVKHWILEVMNREALRVAVDLLGLDNVDRRSVKAMRSHLSRSPRANPAALLANLRVADVRRSCELQGAQAGVDRTAARTRRTRRIAQAPGCHGGCAEARRLDAAIAKNLKALGFG